MSPSDEPPCPCSGLVDIHCHALPRVDDGAGSDAVGLDMLRRARDDGVDEGVLTPHFRPDDGQERARQLAAGYGEFAAAAAAAGVGVRIHLGAEIAFRFGLAQLARATEVARLAGSPYVLVDLPPGPLSPGLEQGFFELRTSGFRPVLAHPERHRDLARRSERLARLRQQELLLQVDAGSLRGRFGRRAQAAAIALVEAGCADFVASDGHDLDRRPMALRSAYDQVRALAGEPEARRLFADNPRRVLAGEPVAAVAPTPMPLPSAGPWRRLRRWLPGAR